MARNGSGVYSLPAGSTVSDGQDVLASQHNTPIQDLETDMNTPRPVVAGGTGASTAATARTNLGLGTGDSPTFAGMTVSGTTSARFLTGTTDIFLVGVSTDTNCDMIMADSGGSARFRQVGGAFRFQTGGDASSETAANATTTVTISADGKTHIAPTIGTAATQLEVNSGNTDLVASFGSDDVNAETSIYGGVGSIKTRCSSGAMNFYVDGDANSQTAANSFLAWQFTTAGHLLPGTDNTYNLGSSGKRAGTIYAATGTINTSDRNEKQDISALSTAERNVAIAAKGLFCKFRYRDAVEKKGDGARIHFGVVAQDLQAAFEAEGLDPWAYGVMCRDQLDDGTYRLGVRYDELMALALSAL
ncbi:MAG: tail fiber domain-containing protein [Pikeienuella sp.]